MMKKKKVAPFYCKSYGAKSEEISSGYSPFVLSNELLTVYIKVQVVPQLVLKPGPARRVDPGPGRPRPETGPGLSKNPLRS